MDLTAWRTFVTVCRLGSLSAAAAELRHSPSAISRQIAGLERRLGVPLIERHARGVRPTPTGEVFRHHASMTLAEADRAVRTAREAHRGARSRTMDAPTRGIYAVTPRHHGHPSAAPLLDRLAAAFGPPEFSAASGR